MPDSSELLKTIKGAAVIAASGLKKDIAENLHGAGVSAVKAMSPAPEAGLLSGLRRLREVMTEPARSIPDVLRAAERKLPDTMRGPAKKVTGLFDALGMKKARANPAEALDGMLSQAPGKNGSREWKQIKAVFDDLKPGSKISAELPLMSNGRPNVSRLNAFNKRLRGVTGKESHYTISGSGSKVHFAMGEATKTASGKGAKTASAAASKAGKNTKTTATKAGKGSRGKAKEGFGYGLSSLMGRGVSRLGNWMESKGAKGLNREIMRPWAQGLRSKKDYMPWMAGTLYGAYNAYSIVAPGDQPLAIG